MILTRTPFRISFFGGGTDYPAWYREEGGAVLATTIDKYCYISCRRLPPFFEYKHRLVYSKSEHINKIDDIKHPAVREIFRFMKIDEGLEIHHDADLPARSGLGSSSSFTVGLLNALYALQGRMITKQKLAAEAIHIEQDMIAENVGSQDQISAAYGGFNRISFQKDNSFIVSPVILTKERLADFQNHIMLFFTGFSRIASEIAGAQIEKISDNRKKISALFGMVDEALAILSGSEDLGKFGRLLDESWKIKHSLTDKISNPHIDEIYKAAKSAGALGGKLLGAGGGGFMMLFARPAEQSEIKEKLKNLLYVPCRFETAGSQVVIYQPSGL